MKVAGIVAEYNPFHNGHKYQIDTLRQNGFTHIISTMSGNFVQRGECAIAHKWARTKMALLSGVDLVIELPTCFSVAPAEKFAFGAVNTLERLKTIDSLAFGCEEKSVDPIMLTANALNDEKTDELIREKLKSGITYAVARQQAVKALFGEDVAKVLSTPNNILATEYLRSLKRLNSKIKPFAVMRNGAMHDQKTANSSIASASYIREKIINGEDFSPYVPNEICEILTSLVAKGKAPTKLENGEKAILFALRKMKISDFEQLCDVSEGFHNRLFEACGNATSLDELYSLAKTKRYTLARIKRLVLCSALSVFEYKMPPYIRVLGFNENGAKLLGEIAKKSEFSFVSSYSDACKISDAAKNYFEFEAACTDFYTLLMKKPMQKGVEFTQGVVKI